MKPEILSATTSLQDLKMHPLASLLFLTLSVPFGAFTVPWTCCSFDEKTRNCWASYFLGFGKSWCLTVVWPFYTHILLSCLNPDAKSFMVIFTKLQASYSLVYFLKTWGCYCFFPLKALLWGDDFIILFQSHLFPVISQLVISFSSLHMWNVQINFIELA